MRCVHLIGLAAALMCAMAAASCSATSATCPFDREHVAILTEEGTPCFRVEVADTAEERQRGLMFVRHMEEDRGMLFLFDRPALQPFWMKNTYISLDIIFIASDGRIVNIAHRTKPLNEESIPSAEPVSAVLEINGGLSDRLGIRPGQRVRHPALGGRQEEGDGRQ